jgi:hypothetical protein
LDSGPTWSCHDGVNFEQAIDEQREWEDALAQAAKLEQEEWIDPDSDSETLAALVRSSSDEDIGGHGPMGQGQYDSSIEEELWQERGRDAAGTVGAPEPTGEGQPSDSDEDNTIPNGNRGETGNRWRPGRRKKPDVPSLPEALPDQQYVASKAYAGTRAGFIFKLDTLGLGYYKDNGVMPPPKDNGHCRGKPVLISLEELVLPPAAGVVPWISPSWLKDTIEGTAKPPRHKRVNGKRVRQRGRKAEAIHLVDLPPTATASDASWKPLGFRAFDTYNTNAWNSAADALATSAADFLAIQEAREPDPEKCRRLENAARLVGWQASINPATRTTAGGASAGVAILGKRGLGLAKGVVDAAYTDRINVKWTSCFRPGGIHITSVYLWTSEGLSERNLALLHRLKRAVRAIKGPWIAAGDWSIEPGTLQSSGWAKYLKGQVFAPEAPTRGDKHYDYFLVSGSLVHARAEAQSIRDVGGRPHRMSRLLVAGGSRER